MEESLKRLIANNYKEQSLQSKFIMDVINVLTKYNFLKEFLKQTIILPYIFKENDVPASYDFQEKILYISQTSLMDTLKQELFVPLKEDSKTLNLYLTIIQIISHEIEHACQNKQLLMQRKTDEYFLIKACVENYKGIRKSPVICERMADLKSRKLICQLSFALKNNPDVLGYSLVQSAMAKKDIYKKSLKGPTLEEYGDCEELSFYKKTEEEIMTTIPLEQRVYLGLPIKEEEYNNFQKELSLGLLLMR